MLEVVTRENRHLYKDQLEQMFRMRHRIFVEQMKWEALRKPDGREIDEFDDESAIYLLLIEDGLVTGSHRLLPTTGPHLFSEHFADMCEPKGLMRGARIYELNRTGMDTIVSREQQLRGMMLLLVGLLEFCHGAGIETLTLLTQLNTLYHCLLAGVTVKPLGLPKKMDGDRQAAIAFVTDQTSLANVREYFQIPHSIVRYYAYAGAESSVWRLESDLAHQVAAE